MLTARSDSSDLLARLAAAPDGVQAAVAAYVRARTSGASRDEALRAHVARLRTARLHPDREQALDRLTKRRDGARARHAEERSTERVSKHAAPLDPAAVRQLAVAAALKALGRS